MKNSLKHITEEKQRIEKANMTIEDYIKCDRAGSMFKMNRTDRKEMYNNYKQWIKDYSFFELKANKNYNKLSEKTISCYDKICYDRDFKSLISA